MLIELRGTTTQLHSLLHLILLNVKTLYDILIVQITVSNNLHYNKTFTLLEDHNFQERSEQNQTPFTVYQLNTGTFTFKFLKIGLMMIFQMTVITIVLRIISF